MQNRNLVLALLLSMLLFSFSGIGQNNTSSPYSRFGIGDLSAQGFGRNKAMGGTGIALRSNYTLNNVNPASYTAMDSMSFILEFGVKAGFSQFKTNAVDKSQNNSDFNFDYLAFAFPITRWWGTSFGVLPISDVGYEINTTGSVTVEGSPIKTGFRFTGEGGMTKAYWSNGFKLHRNLSVGLGMNYVFGTLDFTREIGFEDPSFASLKLTEKAQIRDLLFDFGVQYHGKINSKYDLTVGAIYRKKTKLDADYENLVTKTEIVPDGKGGSTGRTREISSSDVDRVVDLPDTYGIGFAVTKNKKLTLAFDYTHQKWSDARFLRRNDTLVNSNNFALGMEYTPNANSIRSYFHRIRYRFGAHFDNTYLKVRNKQLQDYGLSIGAGLPFKKNGSYINVAFEVGRRGTLNNNLIREDYAKISVNFSLFEHWFVKRKFD
ncbi:MAG: OmpP1/FadL family transporter [Marinifilaceae bacterium]|jgi:long-subunit fatty acid transport protein